MTNKEYIRKVYENEDDENLFSKSDLYLTAHDSKGRPLLCGQIPSTTRCGIPTVPVATWGSIESLRWAFAGLPKHSVIAVCGVGHGRSQGSVLLWNYALQELERQLEPTLIIVYGPETTIPGLHTHVKFIADHITKHFRK